MVTVGIVTPGVTDGYPKWLKQWRLRPVGRESQGIHPLGVEYIHERSVWPLETCHDREHNVLCTRVTIIFLFLGDKNIGDRPMCGPGPCVGPGFRSRAHVCARG